MVELGAEKIWWKSEALVVTVGDLEWRWGDAAASQQDP